MNVYRFSPNDQPWSNWLLIDESKEEPYLLIKKRYEHLFCPVCEMFDHDEALKESFDEGVRIHARGNIVMTDDDFCLFDEKTTQVVLSQKVQGIRLKPIPRTEWSIVTISERKECVALAYKSHLPKCRKCGRFSEFTGLIDYESQISIPKHERTFFTTKIGFQGANRRNRDILLTEDVVRCLKDAGLKGGRFMRLLNRDEEGVMKRSVATTGKAKWPSGVQILL